MIKYNICFIRRGGEFLLLNRERSSWMGCWNGIGGKLEPGETPRESMVRELAEETGIAAGECRLHFKGMITWVVDGDEYGGMYVYLAEVSDDCDYPTPVKTAEGILDWKRLEWIMHPDNAGIAANIPRTMETILQDGCYDHHVVYKGDRLVDYRLTAADPAIETDEALRREFLAKYDRRHPVGGAQ